MLAATPLGGELAVFELAARDPFAWGSAAVAMSPTGDSVVTFQGPRVADSRLWDHGGEILVQRYAAAGTALGDVLSVNSITAGEQSEPAVAADADGNFLVVWSGRGGGDRVGIFGQRFSQSGSPLRQQFRINTSVGGEQTQPAIAMAADGRAIVVWHGPGEEDASGIWMQRLAEDGTLVGEETLVNTTTGGTQAFPSVGTDDAGRFTVAWSSRDQDGDDWGIVAQHFNADGTRRGTEFIVNTTTEGSQHEADVAVSPLGPLAIAWSSLAQDGDSWDVFARSFDAEGDPLGEEFAINERTEGHQRDVDVAMADAGELFLTWNDGRLDGAGWDVAVRAFDSDGNADGDTLLVHEGGADGQPGHQQDPSVALAPTGTSFVAFGGLAASRQESVLIQRFTVDVGPTENVAPQLASVDGQEVRVGEMLEVTVTATDRNLRDTLVFSLDPDVSPGGATLEQVDNNTATVRWTPSTEDRNLRRFLRVFVDDQEGLTDSVQFEVVVLNAPPVVDLNGAGTAGLDTTVDFGVEDTTIELLDERIELSDADQEEIASARVTLRNPLDGAAESISVDVSDTAIAADYNSGTGLLTLQGVDSLDKYRSVLRSLRYTNPLDNPNPTSRLVDIVVSDGTDESEFATVTIDIEGANEDPTLATLPDVEVLAGSPLWVPLDASDGDGDTLVFQASSANASLLTTDIPTANRSLRIEVANSGEMVFELFEHLAPRATERIISLANDEFYDGIIFHRVVDGFVIQTGDPLGTGRGGSDLGYFDDQFHIALQHNQTGLLSMAKVADDTNDSQFFITEGPTRSLDSNHSIFGMLVEGEDVRETISNVEVNANPNTEDDDEKPVEDVVMENVEIFTDIENGMLLLSAPEGASGTTSVTVTVSDGKGGTVVQTFEVTVRPDEVNGAPFLDDIPTLETTVDTPLTYQLTAQDVEDDPVTFLDQAMMDDINANLLPTDQISIPVRKPAGLNYSVDPETGELTITPSNGLTGLQKFTVAVASSADGLTRLSAIDFQVVQLQINPV